MPSRSPGGRRALQPWPPRAVSGSARRGLPPRRDPEPSASPRTRPVRTQFPRPSPARPAGLRPHLDKTSRSSSADSSRSRVLFPHAVPEPPPGRSFSFSPSAEAAMLPTSPPWLLRACALPGWGGGRGGWAGSADEGQDHRGGAVRSGQSAPCGAGGALRTPAPSAGPEGLLGLKPEGGQVLRGQV